MEIDNDDAGFAATSSWQSATYHLSRQYNNSNITDDLLAQCPVWGRNTKSRSWPG